MRKIFKRANLLPIIYSLLFIALWFLSLPGSSLSQVVSPNPSSSLPPISPSLSRPEIGFESKQKLNDHYQKHGKEFGDISREEYLRMAQELRDRPLEQNILETRRRDGVVTRFDRKSGAFLAFNPDGVIRTFFRPNDGETYFWRQESRLPKR